MIHNNNIVVGPREWNWVPFKAYLDNNLMDTSELPRSEPSGPIITTTWKILPTIYPGVPPHDGKFEQPAGPYWTITDNLVTGLYEIVPIELHTVKERCIATVTNSRYIVETQGIMLTVQGQEVVIDTARGSRDIFLQTYLALGETETVNWKFSTAWMTLTKADLSAIVDAGKNYIQSCFDWEKQQIELIMAATSIDEIKTIELRHPLQPEPTIREKRMQNG